MAKNSSNKKQKKPLLRRLLSLLGWALMALFGSTILAALVFRFVPIPFSALMAERRMQSWSGEKPYTPRYQWVALDDIAPCMGVAVIAGEDQNFPEHFGFDWKAIEKAVEHNEKSRRKRGASTVSMQTAKNLFLWETRSWVRKGFEVYFTLLIETTWSKKRILEVYLNIVEFGDGIFGVEAASRAYFGKPAKRLSSSEAALLAAVLPNPHKYHATAPSDYIRGRQEWILGQMRQLGGDQVVKAL